MSSLKEDRTSQILFRGALGELQKDPLTKPYKEHPSCRS